MEKRNEILLPVSLVTIIVTVGVSWGILYQKVEDVRERMNEVKESVVTLNEKFDRLLLESTVGISEVPKFP